MSTETDVAVAPKPLAMATITTDQGSVLVPCEPINEWLAITPEFYMDDQGKTWLDGTFQITHLPTGMAFSTESGCIACARNAGRSLVALDLDWPTLNAATSTEEREAWSAALTDKQRLVLSTVRNLDFMCDADYCDEVDPDGNLVDADGVPYEVDGPQIVSANSIDMVTLTTTEVL